MSRPRRLKPIPKSHNRSANGVRAVGHGKAEGRNVALLQIKTAPQGDSDAWSFCSNCRNSELLGSSVCPALMKSSEPAGHRLSSVAHGPQR